jgi:hypothetical protein
MERRSDDSAWANITKPLLEQLASCCGAESKQEAALNAVTIASEIPWRTPSIEQEGCQTDPSGMASPEPTLVAVRRHSANLRWLPATAVLRWPAARYASSAHSCRLRTRCGASFGKPSSTSSHSTPASAALMVVKYGTLVSNAKRRML